MIGDCENFHEGSFTALISTPVNKDGAKLESFLCSLPPTWCCRGRCRQGRCGCRGWAAGLCGRNQSSRSGRMCPASRFYSRLSSSDTEYDLESRRIYCKHKTYQLCRDNDNHQWFQLIIVKCNGNSPNCIISKQEKINFTGKSSIFCNCQKVQLFSVTKCDKSRILWSANSHICICHILTSYSITSLKSLRLRKLLD